MYYDDVCGIIYYSDHYYIQAAWRNTETVMITWANRVQNESISAIYNVTEATPTYNEVSCPLQLLISAITTMKQNYFIFTLTDEIQCGNYKLVISLFFVSRLILFVGRYEVFLRN